MTDNKNRIENVKKELNDRFNDHHITYRELYEVIGIYNPMMKMMDTYGKLDDILYYNPKLDNGSYI
jgi:hypothetical protein